MRVCVCVYLQELSFSWAPKNLHTQQLNCPFVSFSRGSSYIQILCMKIYARFKSKLNTRKGPNQSKRDRTEKNTFTDITNRVFAQIIQRRIFLPAKVKMKPTYNLVGCRSETEQTKRIKTNCALNCTKFFPRNRWNAKSILASAR